ncbi:unnamed protein product [Closterium sp. Naga37s-1]|nr:unnamed protein product [Closterium sp. Naga37s-1]
MFARQTFYPLPPRAPRCSRRSSREARSPPICLSPLLPPILPSPIPFLERPAWQEGVRVRQRASSPSIGAREDRSPRRLPLFPGPASLPYFSSAPLLSHPCPPLSPHRPAYHPSHGSSHAARFYSPIRLPPKFSSPSPFPRVSTLHLQWTITPQDVLSSAPVPLALSPLSADHPTGRGVLHVPRMPEVEGFHSWQAELACHVVGSH